MTERIVADLRAGMAQRAVAAKHDVSRYVVQKVAFEAGIARSTGAPARSSRRPCETCDRRTRSDTGICRTCTAVNNGSDGYQRGLTGGRWIRHGLIHVWEKEAA
ncbi:hypothetical protein ACIRN4_06240 [Pimelobacter simplex]|uniref:hypothetical protein n=1 Tax=Nocardioides simplex TaxID=2045 RepID=UPI0038101CA8